MSGVRVSFSPASYIKVILHAAKYPSAHVGGYLIGSVSGDKINVEDTLPVCHSHPVGFITELTASVAQSGGRKIVGYYFGNESAASVEVPSYVPSILEDIKSALGGPSPVLARVNFDKLVASEETLALELSIADRSVSGEWTSSKADMSAALDKLLQTRYLRQFADFENHMDSINGESCFLNNFVATEL